MAKLLKLRRGTTTQHSSFTGAEGEVTIDTDKDVPVVHDGSTAGGHPVAAEDMSNVSSASIAGRLSNDSIATSKIAAGALPSDVTVATANLGTTGVTAGAYGSSSAIPIVTVNNKGQVTAASTTAIDSTTIANGTSNVAVANNGNITATRSGTTRLTVGSGGITVNGGIAASGSATTGQITAKSVQEPQLIVQDSDTGHTGNAAETGISFRDGAGTQMGIMGFSNSGDSDYYFDTASTGYRMNFRVGGSTTQLEIRGGECNFDSDIILQAGHTVDGRDVAADGTKLDGLTSSTGVLKSSVTTATQPQSNNSTKVATTAYVRTAISEAQAFPSGTKMLFAQTSAPTGWTKSTTHNNKALRVVSGSASSGGTNAFTSAFGSRGINANAGNTTATGNVSSSAGNTTAGGNVSVANATQGGNVSIGNTTAGGNVSISSVSTSGTVNSHTLSTSQMPSHSHGTNVCGGNQDNRGNAGGGFGNARLQNRSCHNTTSTGGSGGHSHGFSGSSHNHNGTLSGTAHNHNASFSGSAHNHNASFSGSAHNHNISSSFSGSAHNHSISVGNLDMAVQYVDVIIATKD